MGSTMQLEFMGVVGLPAIVGEDVSGGGGQFDWHTNALDDEETSIWSDLMGDFPLFRSPP